MHEYALADAVVRAVARVATDEGLVSVTAVDVRVGELQQIRKDLFESALGTVRPEDEPRLAGTLFSVTIETAELSCRACTRTFSMAEAQGASTDDDLEAVHFVPELAHAFFACPGCGSPDFDVTAGRGVTIASVVGEQPVEA